MSRLSSRQIEAFRAMMLTGSVTRAAQVMYVTQPAVSRLIRDLQAALELTLFERQGTRLTPTHEARALLAEVERSYVGLNRIADAAKLIGKRRAGALRIAAMPALCNGFLPRFAGRYLEQRAGLSLSLFGLISSTVVEWVVSDQCDLGFAVAPIDAMAARSEPLPGVRYVAVVPEGHRLARRKTLRPKDFAGQNFIALGPSTTPSYFRLNDVFSRHDVTRTIRVETPLSGIACSMVAAGAGVSIVDPFTAAEFSTRGVVARRFEPATVFQVTALYPSHRALPPIAREFLSALALHVREFGEAFNVAA